MREPYVLQLIFLCLKLIWFKSGSLLLKVCGLFLLVSYTDGFLFEKGLTAKNPLTAFKVKLQKDISENKY